MAENSDDAATEVWPALKADVRSRDHRRTIKRDGQRRACRAAVAVAHCVAEDVLKMGAGRTAADRRRIVGNVGVRAVRIEREMAIRAGKGRAHGSRAVRGVADAGDRQAVAVEVGSVRQHAVGRCR